MKGIILAGGNGSRIYPITLAAVKPLLPIYDKPMIYYSLTNLLSFGIKDIAIISQEENLPKYRVLFGDGSRFGINIQYLIQKEPRGIADSFIIAEDFIGNDSVCLILGDNIFHLTDEQKICDYVANFRKGGTIFGYRVSDPERYGVIEFDDDNRVISIEEKPKNPKSSIASVGLYIYDNQVVEIAKNLKFSDRGELEITEVSTHYLNKNQLNVINLASGSAWLDAGVPEAMIEAAQYVHTLEKRQGVSIGCPEEIALRNGYITAKQLYDFANSIPGKSSYKQYLIKVSQDASYN